MLGRDVEAGELEQLDPEDPVRVFVSWLCLYARDILSGTLPGPYDQHAAERYAREALMPEQEFLPVAGDPAAELAVSALDAEGRSRDRPWSAALRSGQKGVSCRCRGLISAWQRRT